MKTRDFSQKPWRAVAGPGPQKPVRERGRGLIQALARDLRLATIESGLLRVAFRLKLQSTPKIHGRELYPTT